MVIFPDLLTEVFKEDERKNISKRQETWGAKNRTATFRGPN